MPPFPLEGPHRRQRTRLARMRPVPGHDGQWCPVRHPGGMPRPGDWRFGKATCARRARTSSCCTRSVSTYRRASGRRARRSLPSARCRAASRSRCSSTAHPFERGIVADARGRAAPRSLRRPEIGAVGADFPVRDEGRPGAPRGAPGLGPIVVRRPVRMSPDVLSPCKACSRTALSPSARSRRRADRRCPSPARSRSRSRSTGRRSSRRRRCSCG